MKALTRELLASELARTLGLKLQGDGQISCVAALDRAGPGCLAFAKASTARVPARAVVIAPPGTASGEGAVIESATPRLTFAKALQALAEQPGFAPFEDEAQVHASARVAPQAVLGRGVRIGRGSVISPFAVIADGTQIGEDCWIKPGAVIGEAGFGFERDADGTPIRLIHLGSVRIGNRVEIGSNATVCCGTLDDTVIEDDVKIDDQVHVSHNCIIRRGAMLVACAELCGSVEIAAHAWIGPNSSVLQKLKVGEQAFVGLGVNVLRDVSPGHTVAGYPGRSLGGGAST